MDALHTRYIYVKDSLPLALPWLAAKYHKAFDMGVTYIYMITYDYMTAIENV